MGVRFSGLGGIDWDAVGPEVARGGRFVFFEWCVSLGVVSLRRPSGVYFLRASDSALLRGLPFTAVTALFGWWALPWGVVYTPLALYTNLRGGRDVTAQVLANRPPP